MKQAISYLRISNKDQSNFSIPGQRDFIGDYCGRKSIRLLAEFEDKGQSAKNFDRANWKNLEKFVKENYKNIDYLIVIKYDRFSRNVAEGLNMIEKLEQKYGILVLSVFEEIAIDPSSPFFFKMRTDMLVQAEFELRVIRDRTRTMIKAAKTKGRWLNAAPYGYLNKRDAENKPIIILDTEINTKGFTKSQIIQEIFKCWNQRLPLNVIKERVVKMGFDSKGNSRITKILKNPAYAGMVTHEGQIFKGIHEPIITIEAFNQAQEKFKKKKDIRVVLNDEVPLRGVLQCQCGKYLTAGKSKGRSRYYWYYKCEAHLQINLSGDLLHKKMRELMYHLSLSDTDLQKIKAAAEKKIRKRTGELNTSIPGLMAKIRAVKDDILSTEEKFIKNKLTDEAYFRWNTTLNVELNHLKEQLEIAQGSASTVWAKYSDITDSLKSMLPVYDKATTQQKQRLINLVFNRSLSFHLNRYVCEEILPEFAANALTLKEKGLLVINRPFEFSERTPLSTREGSLLELFELLREIDCSCKIPENILY